MEVLIGGENKTAIKGWHDFLMDIRNTLEILKVTPFQSSNFSVEVDESTNTIAEDIEMIVIDIQ